MDLGAIFIGLAFLIGAGVYVSDPFRRQDGTTRAKDPENSRQSRQDVLLALRDLDFDFQTGKIAAEDHAFQRGQLLAKAAYLTELQDQEEDEIEKLIQDHRSRSAGAKACPACGAGLKKEDRFCPNCGKAAGISCPACGKDVLTGSIFCSACGVRLENGSGSE